MISSPMRRWPDFIRETQISKTQCIEICKLNNPAEGGGFHTRDFITNAIEERLSQGFL
jgi:hypothetical protein